MFNKIIIVIIAAAVIILGGYFLIRSLLSSEPDYKTYSPPSASEVTPTSPAPTTPTAASPESPPADQNTIIYTDSGYSPNTLTVKTGTTVIFKNESSKSMWPASATHPSHRVYSGTSLDKHCPDISGTAFDACAGILPGNFWSFRFDKIGEWKYHNHLSPSYFGAITVE